MLKRYPIRALRYFLFLALLFGVVFGVMLLIGQTSLDKLYQVFHTQWWVLLILFVGLPLAYPLFSYTARDVRGNLVERRAVVDRALVSNGFRITEETPQRIVARATGSKRISLLMLENRIEITPEGNHYIRIEGAKKEVLKIEARMRAFAGL
jgi:hypothetical protein